MNKLNSRKLLVWAVYTILVVLSFIFTKAVSPELLAWYGPITMIYIGSQGAVDTVDKLKNKSED